MPEIDFPQGVWLAPEQNRFGVRVLDCRAFCRMMVSLTGDPAVALGFMELRSSQGGHLHNQRLANARQVAYPLRYRLPPAFTGGQRLADGPLFQARAMEDKWDIFLHGDWLLFARSWTGTLAYRAGMGITPHEMKVSPIEMDGSQDDLEFAVREVDFLIKSHLLGDEVPHPLPAGFPDDAERVLLYSFSQYGRQASYATYANTLAFGARSRFDPDATLPL
jgi:hypothetical protein